MDNLAYEDKNETLGVPYSRPPDDPSSHSYIDLKKEPWRLDEIPELRDDAALKRVVMKINEQGGFFRSIGCERWADERNSADGILHFGSYVGFALDAWPVRRKQAAESIFERFREHGDSVSWPDGVRMIIILRPTIFYDQGAAGWSLEFWCRSSAATLNAARQQWGEAMDRFAEFLELEHAYWRRFLAIYPLAEMVSEGE